MTVTSEQENDEGWNLMLKSFEDEIEKYQFQSASDKEFENGLEKIDKFLDIVFGNENYPTERHQFECIMEYMPIIFEFAFGRKYWAKNGKKISEKCGFTHSKNVIVTIMRRQAGKTFMITIMLVGFLLCFPSMEESGKAEWLIYSNKGDLSRTDLARARELLEERKKDLKDFRPVEHNNNEIRLINALDSDDIRVVRAWQGKITGLAGKYYFIDEFFLLNKNVADRQLPPQLQAKKSKGFFFTTLEERGHWSFRWLHSNKLIHVINYSEVCDECLKLDDPELAVKCPHAKKIQAHYIDSDKRDGVMELMPKRDVLREMYNIVPQIQGQIFGDSVINDCFRKRKSEKLFEFYAMYDPSMTSEDGSYTAVTIIGELPDSDISYICSLDSELTSSPTKIVNFIIKCLSNFIKKFPYDSDGNKKLKIYLLGEHNTVNHSEEVYKAITDDPELSNSIIYIKAIKLRKVSKSKKQFMRIGVVKKKGDSKIFAQTLLDKIRHNKIFIHEGCVTTSSTGLNEMIETLKTQVSHVRAIPDKKSGEVKIVSKLDLNDKPAVDDLYISAVSALRWAFRLKNPREDNDIHDQYIKAETIGENPIFWG